MVLKLDILDPLNSFLAEHARHGSMHISKHLADGTLLVGIHKDRNVTKIMLCFRQEFAEFQMEKNNGQYSFTRLASTSNLINLGKIVGERLTNYVSRRLDEELKSIASGKKFSPPYSAERVYLRRCMPKNFSEEKNWSLTVKHEIAPQFTERLLGYNLTLHTGTGLPK